MGRDFGQTKIANFAFFYEGGHSGDNVFDRDVAVETVAVVEIYSVNTKALERIGTSRADIFWRAVNLMAVVGKIAVGEFGAEEDLQAGRKSENR